MSDELESVCFGLAKFNAALAEAGNAAPFGQLSEDKQDAFLATQEQGDFFSSSRSSVSRLFVEQ